MERETFGFWILGFGLNKKTKKKRYILCLNTIFGFNAIGEI
jgi:hypothetical protein